MNKLKSFAIIFIMLLAPLCFFGQLAENPWQAVSSASNSLRGKLSGKKYNMVYSTLGSQFYHFKFLPTKITLENGEIFENVLTRYNSYLDELVCFNPNLNTLFTIDKFIIKEFELNSQFYGFQKFIKWESDNSRNDERFFHVVYEGNITLLALYKTEEKKIGVYKDKDGILKDSELVLTETFYIYSNQTGLKKFLPIRSSFLSLYSENKKQVKQILRTNRLYKFNPNKLQMAFSLIEKAGITQ